MPDDARWRDRNFASPCNKPTTNPATVCVVWVLVVVRLWLWLWLWLWLCDSGSACLSMHLFRYNDIRRREHDELQQLLRVALTDAARGGGGGGGDDDTPEQQAAALERDVRAAEEAAANEHVAPLRTMQSCFHERLLLQIQRDLVHLFTTTTTTTTQR